METEAFKKKLDEFDQEMEAQHPMFKFVNDYMKFVACIRMFLRATREGNWKPHLESLSSSPWASISLRMIDLTITEWYRSTLRRWSNLN